MSDIFITSDLHLNHLNIIQYCNRPYKSLQEMNEALIANWNSMVRPIDTVYVVGDIVMGRSDEIQSLIQSLNGSIILITGNHDKSRLRHIRPYVSGVHKSLDFEFEGKNVLVRHKPMYDSGLAPIYDFQICGHVHDKFKIIPRMINVSVDVWNYKPIPIEEAMDSYLKEESLNFPLHQAMIRAKGENYEQDQEEEGMGSAGAGDICTP